MILYHDTYPGDKKKMKEYEECDKTLGIFEVYRHPTKFKDVKKMRNDLLKKGLVFGIILLFIGLSVISSNANVVKKSSDPMVSEVYIEDYTNYLGTMYFNFSRFSVDIAFEHPEDTDYTFPVVEGNYTFNFTVELNTTSEQKMLLPRVALTYAKISTDDTPIWAAVGINFIRGEFVGPWTIKDIERNYNEPPINGAENISLSIILRGRGFPFGFLKPEETSFTITAHFEEE